MKKILSLIIFIFFYFNNCLAINLPNDVSSGNNYFKSMDEFGQFKDYGVEIVSKSDGYPVRSGQKSLRFEISGGDCQKILRKLHQLEYIWANFTQRIRNMVMREIHLGCFLIPQEKI